MSRTLQPEEQTNAEFTCSCSEYNPVSVKTFIFPFFTYVAEQHGVFGPAVVGAEFLCGASVLSRHQLLGRGLAEDAGLTVFPPLSRQLLLEELRAA